MTQKCWTSAIPLSGTALRQWCGCGSRLECPAGAQPLRTVPPYLVYRRVPCPSPTNTPCSTPPANGGMTIISLAEIRSTHTHSRQGNHSVTVMAIAITNGWMLCRVRHPPTLLVQVRVIAPMLQANAPLPSGIRAVLDSTSTSNTHRDSVPRLLETTMLWRNSSCPLLRASTNINLLRDHKPRSTTDTGVKRGDSTNCCLHYHRASWAKTREIGGKEIMTVDKTGNMWRLSLCVQLFLCIFVYIVF